MKKDEAPILRWHRPRSRVFQLTNKIVCQESNIEWIESFQSKAERFRKYMKSVVGGQKYGTIDGVAISKLLLQGPISYRQMNIRSAHQPTTTLRFSSNFLSTFIFFFVSFFCFFFVFFFFFFFFFFSFLSFCNKWRGRQLNWTRTWWHMAKRNAMPLSTLEAKICIVVDNPVIVVDPHHDELLDCSAPLCRQCLRGGW